ncbi:MAG: type VI secretion system tube protein Hcp [Pseudomonadota bacterium]
MKKLVSVMLAIIIITGLCTTAVYGLPVEDYIETWIITDNGDKININMLQYPQVTIRSVNSGRDTNINQPVLEEIVIEAELDKSQKYLQAFKSGTVIPELVINAVNQSFRPVYIVTLKNCVICGYNVSELKPGRLTEPVKAVIRLNADIMKVERAATNAAPILLDYTGRLDTGKLFINGAEYNEPAVFSGFDGYSMVTETTIGLKQYGSPLFNSSGMSLEYDMIGALPNWLANVDIKNGGASSVNPVCKLRYELSNTLGSDQLILEADLTADGQQLELLGNNHIIFCNYNFRVHDLKFVSPSASSDPKPVLTISPLVREPIFRRASDLGWSGNWVTTFGKMTLRQEGANVTGEYGNPVETLVGTVSGSKVSGTWHDSFSTGKFEFTMAADGSSFTGIMYNQALGERGTFEWSGDRE